MGQATSPAPGIAVYWRRWRFGIAVFAALLVTALIIGIISNQGRRGYLDPEGVDAVGAGALAELLSDQGVAVSEVRRTEEAVAAARPDTTLLITVPDLLRPQQVQRVIATGADIVLVAPAQVVTEFSPAVVPSEGDRAAVREPGCELAEAVRAGSARLAGRYTGGPEASCYGGALVVDRLDADQRLVVLGTAEPLTNRYLDDDGNAALAMGLLGRHPELIWYRPVPEEIAGLEGTPLSELLPGWVAPVGWQLGIAALFVAWWRGRRLGRVVPEPLPVVVRAAEATEGRARLYRRGRARGHAADTLREAASERLRHRLGLPPDAGTGALAEAVAARTGRPSAAVADLLGGREPADDASLVHLADELDALEQEVRNP